MLPNCRPADNHHDKEPDKVVDRRHDFTYGLLPIFQSRKAVRQVSFAPLHARN